MTPRLGNEPGPHWWEASALTTAPSLHPRRERLYPILLTGDLKKAFLQTRLKETERDSLRIHWRPPYSCKTMVFRFTCAFFGMTCSPFLFGGVINQHLDMWERRYPELVKEVRESMYVDDLMSGGETVELTAAKKATATEIFSDATFTIHRWHSNAPELEAPRELQSGQAESILANQQLEGARPSEAISESPSCAIPVPSLPPPPKKKKTKNEYWQQILKNKTRP